MSDHEERATREGGPERRRANAGSGDDRSGPPHGLGEAGDGGGHPGGTARGRDYDQSPLIATWEVTQACSLSCDHCRAEAVESRHPEELTTAEGRDLIDQVAQFDPVPVLVLSGGDPLKRPDLFELVAYAAERVPTAVTPAPTERLTRETVDRLADLGVRRMALSLDGATAASHDGFRGETGSFERVRQAAAWADDAGLDVQVNTTVTTDTVDELPAVAERVGELGAVMWEVFFLVPVGRGNELDGLSPERAESVLGWLYEQGRSAPYRIITVEAPHYRRVASERSGGEARVGSTRAGRGFVFVSHTGEVYPSGFLPTAVGDVREQPLPAIYREADLMRVLRDADQFAGPCGRCSYRRQCGGSRSRAHAATGDPLGSDPLCLLVDEADDRSGPAATGDD